MSSSYKTIARYKDIELYVNGDTKKYKGWYYNKIIDAYYVFSPDSKITCKCFTIKSCKNFISTQVKGEGQ